MKKKRYFFLIALMAIGLSGCQMKSREVLEKVLDQAESVLKKDKAEDNPENRVDEETDKNKEETKENPDDASEEESQIKEAPQLRIWNYMDNEWDGQVTLIEASYDTLNISGDAYPQLTKVAEQYNQEAAAQVKEWKDQNREYAREQASYGAEYFYGYEYMQKIRPKRIDEHVLSFAVEYSEYAGGAHGVTSYGGRNYDVSTGREIVLEDVVADMRKLPEIIVKELSEKYPPEMFFDGYEEQIAGQFQSDSPDYPVNWTIDPCGLTFYYSHYELSPYAAGCPEVLLPFDKYPGLFKEPYCRIPEEYAVPLTEYDTQYVDVNGDGELEEIYLFMYNAQPGYESSEIHVCVNEKDTVYYTNADSWFGCASLMRLSDGSCYLYVDVSEVDDMSRIFVFFLNGGGAIYEGEYPGGLGSFVTDPGKFEVFTHLDALSTYSGYKYCHVGNDGLPEPDDKAYTIVPFQYENEPEHCLTAKIPVSVWMVEADGSVAEEPEELPAGTRFYFRRTDNRSYVEMELEDGRHCQIRVDLSSWPRTIDGVDESECFDGILYAG